MPAESSTYIFQPVMGLLTSSWPEKVSENPDRIQNILQPAQPGD